MQWAGDRKGRPYGEVTRGAVRRAVGDAGPYESVTRGAMGGRPQGSPLRKRYKRCNGRATARVAPTEAYLAVRRGGALPLPRAG